MDDLSAKDGKTRWVLVVDDDPGVVVTLGEVLEKGGFRPLFAHTASEAKTKLRNQLFDCIITDMCLGNGSGEDVILEVRSDKHGLNRRTPILVISAFLDADLVARIKPDVNGILVKPFKIASMIERICSVILPEEVPSESREILRKTI